MMSPLRYQKQLRLQHAHVLMLVERLDAAQAAFAVRIRKHEPVQPGVQPLFRPAAAPERENAEVADSGRINIRSR